MRRPRKGVGIGRAVVSALLGVLSMANAQTTPFADFTNLSPGERAALRGKLTWVGPQREMVPSVAYAATGVLIDVAVFAGARTPGFDYKNDQMTPESFNASVDELTAVIAGLGGIGAIGGGGAGGGAVGPADGVLSVALATGSKVFESVVGRSDASAVLSAMLNALPGNAQALGHLTGIGCAGNVLPGASATDVSGSLTITRSGIRRSRASGRFVQTVTLENTSSAALAGPLSVILGGLPGSTIVVNKAGTTCQLGPPGRPFVNVSSGLGAGARAEVLVEFDNPDDLDLTYTTAVVSGGGPR